MSLSRRKFLLQSGLIGCSLAASPLVTPVSYAAAPWDHRLVVIILRGGMDGLDVVQPYGDPLYAELRKSLPGGPSHGAKDLDGFFALNAGLEPLMPLWAAGELAFVQAVSTPYRDKRSHFDGQDLLEAGTPGLNDARDGWLNRMLTKVSGVEARTAFAVGQGDMKLLSGPAPVTEWSPDAKLRLSAQAERLAGLLMEEDPLFHASFSQAVELTRQTAGEPSDQDSMGGEMDMGMSMATMQQSGALQTHQKIAAYTADQLRGDTRIAAFSLNGWDTHAKQQRVLGRALSQLAESILTLKAGCGEAVWSKTSVVAMTEFGRTARGNGTGGTDHGTGGAMLLAGGAIKGGRVYGRWPGLAEADLFDRRDLMPTGDVRAQAAWIMRGMLPISQTALETHVFPGLDMGANPGLLL